MFIEMVSISVSIVDRAFKNIEGSVHFFKWLIISLLMAGIVLGVAGGYLSRLIWLVEVLIAPTLIWAIKGYQSTNRDSIGLLHGVNETLRGARNQEEIENRIKREKSNE